MIALSAAIILPVISLTGPKDAGPLPVGGVSDFFRKESCRVRHTPVLRKIA